MTTRDNPATGRLAPGGERSLVARIRQRFPDRQGLLQVGIGDDAAVAAPARGALEILTTDALVEGIHFDLSFCSLSDVGYKALAVNASDVASMGGRPRLALLSLMLPPHIDAPGVDVLLDGFALLAGETGVTLAGGNITRSPGPLVVDVALIGSVRPRRVLTRAGGRPGDALYLTGAVGAAAAGLQFLRSLADGPAASPGEDPDLLTVCAGRYRRPEPRVRFGAALGSAKAASACMDLSDGLADAVRQVAAASGTGARLDAAALPIPACARRLFTARGEDPVHAALTGGDDYELLFSVPARRGGRLRHALAAARGLPVTRIGELTLSPDLVVVRDGRPEPLPAGFEHF